MLINRTSLADTLDAINAALFNGRGKQLGRRNDTRD
jgi:hypothetical protein